MIYLKIHKTTLTLSKKYHQIIKYLEADHGKSNNPPNKNVASESTRKPSSNENSTGSLTKTESNARKPWQSVNKVLQTTSSGLYCIKHKKMETFFPKKLRKLYGHTTKNLNEKNLKIMEIIVMNNIYGKYIDIN